MEDIAAIDIVIPPPVVIEVVTGEKGDTGPPGPAGIPGPHAPSHTAAGEDPVDVTALAGYPGGTASFLRADHTFAVPPAGDELPMAPLGQVLSSQGPATPPVFTPNVLLISPAAGQGWTLYVEPGGDFVIRHVDASGGWLPQRVGIDPYQGGFYTIFGSIGAANGAISGSWFAPLTHTFAECVAPPFQGRNAIGNLVTISDSTTNTPGAVIAGGGTFSVLARWNGTNWIVIGG